MSESTHIGLDNPAFRGRLRQPSRPIRPVGHPSSRYVNDIVSPRPFAQPVAPAPAPKPTASAHVVPVRPKPQHPKIVLVKPQPFVKPTLHQPQSSIVLHRQAVRKGLHGANNVQPSHLTKPRRSRSQMALLASAAFIFIVGLSVTIITFQTNQSAKTQVAALSKQTDSGDASTSPTAAPSETRPSAKAVSNYEVAPNFPKTIKIPKLGVNARITPLGVTSQDALQAPTNIYDTGWYNASAKPGDPGSNGAMLIDGHVHGPTLPGVFMNIKTLVAGDVIQVIRGDNETFNYTVVKTQNYNATDLNIGTGLTSIKPGEPGLNLITCGGPYDKQSGEYTQRTMVFAVQTT